MQKLKTNFYAIASVLFLLAVVTPLLLMARYNVPAVDDYSYGADTYQALRAGGNIIDALKVAFLTVADTYRRWQGTFTGILLMALQPDVWGNGCYAITTYIILPVFVLAQLFFGDVVLHGICKVKRSVSIVIICVVTGIQILWAPYPVEAFFWYNGAIFYTFYYGLMLILLGCLLQKLFCSRSVKWYSYIVVILLAVFIGGGNYVTGLVLLELHALLILYVMLRDKSNPAKVLLFTSTMALLISFVINIAAPGNALRANSCEPTPALQSIIRSFISASRFMAQWTSILVVFSVLLLLPFLWKVVEGLSFGFKYPLLVSGFSFCFLASHYTPTWYAQSYAGPGRLCDVIYYTYWVLLVANVTYWLGWLKQQLNRQLSETTIHEVVRKCFGRWQLLYFVALLVGYVLSVQFYGYENTSSYSALKSLRNGEAKVYYAEHQERLVLLEDESLKEVELKDFTAKPYVLYMDDITEDAMHWRNSCMKDYYQKDKVVRVASE